MELQVDQLASPIGRITLVADGRSLVALDFEGCEARLDAYLARRFGPARRVERDDPLEATSRLAAYLAGALGALYSMPVDPGGTPFQHAVWLALRRIPPGTTSSYGALAARLGRPGAARAVGHANSQNPIAIVLPCHRVVGAQGALTGYAGGLERKRWLLEHEGAVAR